MNIAICGASGCVGSYLKEYFIALGHHLFSIERRHLTSIGIGELQEIIDSSDVVINVAGTAIDRRWSRKNLSNIFDSRVNVTKRLVDVINRSPRPRLFICASAAGYHSSEELSSTDIEPQSILTNLVNCWEEQARRLNPKSRLVIARLSVVFTPKKGALPKMLASHKFGFIAKIGSRKKLMSWIALEDVARAIEHIINHEEIDGAVNISNPHPTTQAHFIECIKQRLGSRVIIPTPLFVLRLIYGKAAQLIMQNGHSRPIRLQQIGYKYIHPTIDDYFTRADL